MTTNDPTAPTPVAPAADYEALAALAEAATPGPWRCAVDDYAAEDGGVWPYVEGPAPEYRRVTDSHDCEWADPAFTAAANPTTVLALIADLRTARRAVWASEEIDRRAGMLAGVTAERDAEKARADAAVAAVARVATLIAPETQMAATEAFGQRCFTEADIRRALDGAES